MKLSEILVFQNSSKLHEGKGRLNPSQWAGLGREFRPICFWNFGPSRGCLNGNEMGGSRKHNKIIKIDSFRGPQRGNHGGRTSEGISQSRHTPS